MFHRTVILFLLCLCALSVSGQPGELNRTDPQGRKQGAWAKTWDNGTLRYQGQFKDDKPFGEFKHFDEEGTLTTEQIYEADGTTSTARHFHPDGSLMAEGKYGGRNKEGIWNYYDPQGQLRRVEHFTAGELDGEVVTHFANGQVAERTNYDKGRLNGVSKSWFDNGMLRSEENYVNGVGEGKMILHYPSGKKELEGSMKGGERQGTWFHFNNDGSVHVKLVYSKGELVKEIRENGTFREEYGNEQPKSEITYKKGKREGAWVEYHNNGRWVLKQMPADPVSGAKADVERELQGQTKKIEGTYMNDLLEGDVKEYDEKGRLLKVTKYVGGVVVGEEVKR